MSNDGVKNNPSAPFEKFANTYLPLLLTQYILYESLRKNIFSHYHFHQRRLLLACACYLVYLFFVLLQQLIQTLSVKVCLSSSTRNVIANLYNETEMI